MVSEPCPELSRVWGYCSIPLGAKKAQCTTVKLVGSRGFGSNAPSPRNTCRSQRSEENIDGAYGLPGVKMSLQHHSLFEGGLLEFMRTDSPTSARHGDGLGYTRIWASPPKRLVFLGWCSKSLRLNCHKEP